MRLNLFALEDSSKAIFLSSFFYFRFLKIGMRMVMSKAGINLDKSVIKKQTNNPNNGEFDPGSGLTLAACLTHASQGERSFRGAIKLADG